MGIYSSISASLHTSSCRISMAYTSSSFSSSFSSSNSFVSTSVPRYDVFISFRGKDTRHSFTDHVYKALVTAGLRTCRDDNIGRGQELTPEIEGAIRQSRASIVVLSKNYANSRWCLDELVLILEQRRHFGHYVLPVFHLVDPGDVRNQRKSFVIEEKKWSEYNVNRWKAALTEVANLTGMVLEGAETIFIAKIVDTVNFKLDRKLVNTLNLLTGMETRAEGINAWLKDEHSGTEVQAICAMEGSGKTTLARYVYNSNKYNFESSSFLQDIGKHCHDHNDLIGLQRQLLKDISGGKNIDISNVCEGTHEIKKALQRKRALIVLDDIDEQDVLYDLLGTKPFHTQSKIIITSRLQDIKAWLESISRRCQVHRIQLLNDEESLELLSFNAFGFNFPMEGLEQVALDLARYCEGNPLALKVLGRALSDASEDRNSVIKDWRTTLASLNKLEGDVDSKIRGILRNSYDSLPHDSQRQLFLHIAIFFVGEYEDNVVNILEHNCYAQSGIKTLVNRCLLSVSPEKRLTMHTLLQEMGRTIVREESNDPAKRSRVWHEKESKKLLRKQDGSKTIEGLSLKLSGTKQVCFKTDSLIKMGKLKLLQLNNVKLNGSYDKFPELTWLCWHGCHLKTIPSDLFSSSLVAIDMSYGSLNTFEPPMVLTSLKILNFKECHNLQRITNFKRLPNLKTLILRGCFNLHISNICKTIGGLKNLVVLDLSRDTLIREEMLFPLPASLEILYMDYCMIDSMKASYDAYRTQSLRYISLQHMPYEFLPKNIDLSKLVVLDVTASPALKSLISLPSTLRELCTRSCNSMEKITFQSSLFRLQNFVYRGCPKLSEVQGLFKLVPISEHNDADLGHMQWIKKYQDHKVDLMCSNITKRVWHIQMLYEYGIRSTYLKGVKDESVMKYKNTTPSSTISFHVPLYLTTRKVQGLNVSASYRSSSDQDQYWRFICLQISTRNKNKKLAWVYNPWVYCKPGVDEDVVWLSYWPFGTLLDPGDEVHVSIKVFNGIGSVCGVSLVYYDTDGEIERENNAKEEEIIGGDLSEFEVLTGEYFLCRYPTVDSEIFKAFFPEVKDLQGWRKSVQSNYSSFTERETSKNTELKDIWLGGFTSKTKIPKIVKDVSKLEGIETVKYDSKTKLLLVSGYVDRMTVVTCVREVENTVEMVDFGCKDNDVKHNLKNRLPSRWGIFAISLVAGVVLWYVWLVVISY